MAEGGDMENEWELSKENVQPLKSGRKIANLSAALQPHSADQMARLKEERKHFENEIRMYSGDDALEPWYQYIEWTEQNFPKGGKENHLAQLLQACVEKFCNEKHYHGDPRLLDIWIKFANICNVPIEIYRYLSNNGIGSELAAFYEAFAWEYERSGNTKLAASVYQQGIERGAQPIDLLRKKHEEFEARVARMTMSGELAARPPSPELCRATLGQLKGRGKDKKAPVNRAVPASQARQVLGPRLNSEPMPAPQVAAPSFSIHSDAGPSGSSLPPQTGEYASKPSKQSIKENEQTPGPWTKAKVKQKHVASVSTPSTPAFSIHEDPHATDTPMLTPRKMPESSNILSAKKQTQKLDQFAFYQNMIQENPRERPMYDKYMIYGGAEEYSFEEIRAIKHLKLMKKRRAEKEEAEEKERVKREQERAREQQLEEVMKAHQQQIQMLQEQLQSMASSMKQLQEGKSSTASCQQLRSAMQQKQAMLEETIMQHEDTTRLHLQHKQQMQQQQPPPAPAPSIQIHTDDTVAAAKTSLVQAKPPPPEEQQQHQHQAPPSSSMDHSGRPSQALLPPPPMPPAQDSGSRHNLSQSSLDSANTAEIMGFSISKLNASATPSMNSANLSSIRHSDSRHSDSRHSDSRFKLPTPDTGGCSLNVTSSGSSHGSMRRGRLGGGGVGEFVSADSSLKLSQGSNSCSRNTSGFGGLAAPSPTVNTKNALNVVMGMFNQSLYQGKEFGWQQQDNNEDEILEAQFAATDSDSTGKTIPGIAPSAPFTIYDENQTPVAPSINPPASAPFSIYDENQPSVATSSQASSAPFTIYDENQPSVATSSQASSAPFTIYDENQPSVATSSQASSAPFTIYDENQPPSATQRAAVSTDSIPIYSDPTDKENCSSTQPAPAVSSGAKVKRGLGGISRVPQPAPVQPTAEVYEVAMPDEDEVLSQQHEEEEPMEGMECGGDMTFAPSVASTCNFTAAARLASTPFNPRGAEEKLPQPPISNIKAPLGDASSSSATVGTCDGSSENVTAMDNTAATTARRESMFTTQQLKDLSPIMETSDESNKSHHAASNQGQSTIHTMSTTARHHSTTTCSSSSSPPKMSMSEFQQSAAASTTTSTSSVFFPSAKDKQRSSSSEEFEGGVGNVTLHEIDVTNYSPESLDKTSNNAMNMSMAIDPHNPFDEELVTRFLAKLKQPIQSYPNYHGLDEPLPEFQVSSFIALGEGLYGIKSLLGEGAYAKVFRAVCKNANQSDFDDVEDDLEAEEVVIKVQSPACPWEFYVTCELHRRLQERFPDNNVCASVMRVDDAFFYTDGSCLVNELSKNGTLLDFVNLHKKAHENIHGLFLLYLTIQLLKIAEQMQACDIIHGDIKPDNFLFLGMPSFESFDADEVLNSSQSCVRLIDFGRSIDMKQFPASTTFLAKVNTSGFECIEMKTDRPWTWQTDMFGIIGTIHILAFGKYMKVYNSDGTWKINSKFMRYNTGADLFSKLFHSLLNIPSCDELPDLAMWRHQFEDEFRKNYVENNFSKYLKKVTIMYLKMF